MLELKGYSVAGLVGSQPFRTFSFFCPYLGLKEKLLFWSYFLLIGDHRRILEKRLLLSGGWGLVSGISTKGISKLVLNTESSCLTVA